MDERDIEEFCRRVSPKLVGALVLQCSDQGLAEDLAQETLARTWERWREVSQMLHPEGWVFRVAFNLASSERRRVRAAARAHDRLRVGDRAGHEDLADRLAIRAALASLPERQRAAIVCRYYADLSVAQTAEVLGCAEGTVKALCHQGVDGLRGVLGPGVARVDLGDTDG